jgi:CMP-N-acetylneuraminic acid synthetase
MKYEILGLIPARGGSKGIPRKNIIPLCGKPLISYTIEEALKSKYLTKIVTSTDAEEIAKIATHSGSEVIIRPKELATDESFVIDTVKHAINFIEDKKGLKFDYVILLQPTSPLRTVEDIDSAIKKMLNSKADSVVSVTEVGAKHPARMKKIVNERIVDIFDKKLDFTPRQKLPKIYIRNGAIYGAKREVIYKNNSFRGNDCVAYIMSEERSINIDTEIDFKLAELVVKNVKDTGNRT